MKVALGNRVGKAAGKGVPNPSELAVQLFDPYGVSGDLALSRAPRPTGDRRDIQEGRCYTYDGTNDYVDVGSSIIGATSDFTIAGWFNASALTSTKRLAAQGSSGGAGRLYFSTLSTGKVNIFINVSGTDVNLDTITTFSASTWYHVAVTRSGNLFSLYVNGAFDRSGSFSNVSVQQTDFVFGASTDLSGHFGGSQFDWRIWNGTALNATQISDIYNFGAGPSLPTLWYKMDEQAGTVSYDSSGNDNDGTITNATLSTFHGTQDVYSFQNEVGSTQRMYFDGVNDGVNVGLNMRSGLTASAFSFKFDYIHFENTDELRASIIDFRNGGTGFSIATVGSAFSIFQGGATTGTFSYVISQYEYHEYGVTISGTSATLYVDGVSNQTITLSSTPTFGVSNGAIGYQPNGPVYYTCGIISDVRLYNSIDFTGLTKRYLGYGNLNSNWIEVQGSGVDGILVGSPDDIYLPRDESDTPLDASGDSLQFSGKAPMDGKLQ
jgi:hypothetical protein